MRASSDLERLFRAARSRIVRLEILFDRLEQGSFEKRRILVAYLVVELDNLLSNFARELAISILGGTRTVGGAKAYAAVRYRIEAEASAFILKTMSPQAYLAKGSPPTINKREEPSLRHPTRLRKFLQSSSASNLTQIDRAMSLNARVFDQTPTIRNFFAHKNRETSQQVANLAANLGVPHLCRAEELVCARVRSAPSPLFRDWTAEAKVYIEECVA